MTDRHSLETLFRRRLISRAQFVQGLLTLGVTASGIEALVGAGVEAAHADAATAQYLVVIVLDAFRPDYLKLAPTPAIADLMARGAVYDRAWVGQLESETPTGHATLASGSMPKHTGVIGFEWRDPKSGTEALDGWTSGVLAGKLEADLKGAGAPSIAAAVKAVDRTAKVVSISSEKVYAADAMGGAAADFILFHAHSGLQGPLTPSAVGKHAPPKDFFDHPHLRTAFPLKHFTDWDYLSTMLALTAVDSYKPKVLMVNLPSGDVYGHPYGGPAAPDLFSRIVAGIDRNIARIVQAYKQAGIHDRTLFVITADHGIVPNFRSVDGLLTKKAVAQAGGRYLFHTGGTAADIYLKNPGHARAVASQMARVPNVAGAYYQVMERGQYRYLPAPGIAVDPGLDAAYQYLLGTFSGPTAPDVVAPFRENTIGTALTTAHGDHGGLNWGAQNIPLILAGPGVRSGTLHSPARLMDVTPTMLRLLGIQHPRMDGIVLADALMAPTAHEVAAQTALTPSLTAYQDALIAQAEANFEEDTKARISPPKPSAARP